MSTATWLLLAALLAPEGSANGPQRRLVVSPLGPSEPQAVTPHSVTAFSFLISNPAPSAVDASWRLEFPAAWSPLGDVEGSVHLESGSQDWVPLLFAVPREAAPGAGELTLVLVDPRDGFELARSVRPYSVSAAGRLEFVTEGRDREMLAWDAYTSRSWLNNASNVPVEVELEALSSTGWEIELSTPRLTLGPGSGAWVEVRVQPPGIRGAEVHNTVSLLARTHDLPEGQGQALARSSVTVLSDEAASGRPVMHGWIELEALLPEAGDAGVGVNLGLLGKLDRHRRLDLRLGERLPFGAEGALARRASYLDLEDERWGGLLVGRTSYAFTRLTAYPQWGQWAEVRGRAGPATLSLFSSLSPPDTVIGQMRGAALSLTDTARGSYRLLAYQGERAPSGTPSQFAIVSLSAEHQIGPAWLEAEVAVGRLEATEEDEPAMRLATHGSEGRWDWSGEIQAASELFPGAIWNLREVGASAGYRVTPDFRVWIGGRKQRSPDPLAAPAADAERDEAGIRWRAFRHGSLSVSRSETSFGPTSSRPNERVETLTRLSADVDLLAKLLATVELDLGERREAASRESVTRPSYTLRYRPNERWLLRAQLRPQVEEQEIFDYRQRWAFLARWQAGDRTWFDIAGQRLDCGRLAETGCNGDPAVQLSLDHQLGGRGSKWRVSAFAQQQGGRDPTAGLRLRRDFALRSPLGADLNEVLGEVLVPQGLPVPVGALVHLGERSARVDPEGRFRVARVPPGDHLLRIDEGALGVALVSPPARAVSVWSKEHQPTHVSLRLREPGSVRGRVWVSEGSMTGPDVSPDPGTQADGPESTATSEGQPFGGLAVHFQHLTWPELHGIAVTGADGSFSLAGMVPGPWRIWPEQADVPESMEVGTQGYLLVQVLEGEMLTLEPILLVRRERPEQLRETPALSVVGSFWGGGSD
jgi:hypothetical protein